MMAYMSMPQDKQLAHLQTLAADHYLRSDAIDKATSTADLKQVLKEMLQLDKPAMEGYLETAREEALRQREEPTELVVGHAEREASSTALRILVIDGGGIKGLVPALIIEELEKVCGGNPVWDLFDLVCGTSTGGIIAIGTCVARCDIKEMIDVFMNKAADIWIDHPHNVAVPFAEGKLMCNGGGKYGAAGLENILKRKTTKDGRPMGLDDEDVSSQFPRTCVTAVEVATRTVAEGMSHHIFSSYPRQGSPHSNKCEAWQAGRATGAAPTFLDPIEIDTRQYVDGGLWANNPTEAAIREAERVFPGRKIGCIVSLGCGKPDQRHDLARSGMTAPIAILEAAAVQSEQTHRKIVEDCVAGVDEEQLTSTYSLGVPEIDAATADGLLSF